MQARSRSFLLHAGGVIALIMGARALQLLVETVLLGPLARTGGMPGPLPAFATNGETALVYTLVAGVVSNLLVPLAIAYVGYRYGKLEAGETAEA